MQKYKHILFDLDRTLWDFDTDTRNTIKEIFYDYGLDKKIDFDEWYATYKTHNIRLWEDYAQGKVTKAVLRDTRFYLAFNDFGIDDKNLGIEFGKKFVEQSPDRTTLFPNAHEILTYLSGKNYQLHVVTNGFNEIQFKKLEATDIKKYFNKIFTCEDIGYNKPHIKFFNHVLSSLNSSKKDAIIIGDDFVSDILGAMKFGINQIYFKPEYLPEPPIKPTFQINSLIEIKNIL
ncbi:MAG: YjjG family noncanonical pyrimidine nucleotidase [Prevotellaceae bacterium]|jgi:putative hydrolase of the HAD superfamily|nr:YjjG family noncanonical pyrimidine nucleotidase [Prevotellaceae bacterium]